MLNALVGEKERKREKDLGGGGKRELGDQQSTSCRMGLFICTLEMALHGSNYLGHMKPCTCTCRCRNAHLLRFRHVFEAAAG